MDARRRQWIAWDVLFYGGDLGVAIRERFGPIGWVVFGAFLCTCKRNSVQGQMSYTSDAQALVAMDIPDLPLIDEHGQPWTLDEFWTFLGRRHQVRKQRRGRTIDIVSSRWTNWQKVPGRPGGDDDTSTASKKTTSTSAQTTPSKAKVDTQTGRSNGKNTEQLETITDDDSNPDPDIDLDPDPDLDPERERDLDFDPDPDAHLLGYPKPRAYEPIRQPEGTKASTPSGGGKGQGSGWSNQWHDVDYLELIKMLENVCTGNHRPTVHSEAMQVIALAAPHFPVFVVEDCIVALDKNPPTLPRALLAVLERECQKRGKPWPLLKLPRRAM